MATVVDVKPAHLGDELNRITLYFEESSMVTVAEMVEQIADTFHATAVTVEAVGVGSLVGDAIEDFPVVFYNPANGGSAELAVKLIQEGAFGG